MNFAGYFWAFAVAIGPLLLAIAFAYVLLRRRRLTRREQERRDRATDRIYQDKG